MFLFALVVVMIPVIQIIREDIVAGYDLVAAEVM